MFKLFKDLTRPPERLDQPTPAPQTQPISAPSSLGYTARQRTRPLPPPTDGAGPSGETSKNGNGNGNGTVPAVAVEVEEVDEDAKKVVEHLKALDGADTVMAVVEVSPTGQQAASPSLENELIGIAIIAIDIDQTDPGSPALLP